jgi:hypothetical protein
MGSERCSLKKKRESSSMRGVLITGDMGRTGVFTFPVIL